MIVVDHVTKYYGSHAAVRDLDFRIDEGECVGFLGLNGAGKTTTLRLLSCLLLPTSGRVTVRGLDVEEDPHEIRKLIGFLPDRPPVYPEMRVVDYLRFAGKLRQMTKEKLEARIPQVLRTCALWDVADDVIQNLSHGYQQRVGIAQAIIHEPTLLILDEPIQGLDPVQIVEMRGMIRELRGKHTILLSTHILSEIEQTCDRIMMLHQGRIAAEGTEEELRARFGIASQTLMEVEISLPKSGGGYRDDALGTAHEALEKLEGVARVSSSGSGRTRTVKVALTADVIEDVVRTLVQKDFGVRRVDESAESGLENIFVNLSRETEEAEA